MENKKIDISECEKEPVRFIGCIQPFGALLVLNEQSLVSHHSENFEAFTGLSQEKLLGQGFDLEALDPSVFSISVLRTQNQRLVEIEKNSTVRAQNINLQLERLQSCTDLQTLLETATKTMAEVSGHNRVMLYKFHEDLHGEVVAETIHGDMDSFLGLHYPASDIPPTSRAVLLENWVRMIPDVSNSLNIPILGPTPAEQLDLGHSLLRAVSPIHLEYLRNMDVRATLTVSIIVEGKLWGLFACHHPEVRYVSKLERDYCETVGRMVSSLIRDAQLKEISYHASQLKVIHRKLLKKISHTDDLAKELTESTPTLVDIIDSEGAAAALYMDGQWVSVGTVPNEKELDDLVSWLGKLETDIFHTNQLSQVFPEARSYQSVASGLLAALIPKTNRNFILWFRPEVIQTVKWAGRPEKSVNLENGRLSPRTSFEEWKESVAGLSLPWQVWEIDAAVELRNAIVALDLRRQYEKEQKARAEAERAIIAREELMAMVSHDLKNPLTSMQMNAQLLKRFIPAADVKSRGIVDRLHKSMVSMNSLIDDILSVTKLEAGQLELEYAKLPLHAVIDEAIELLQPIAASKQIRLERVRHSLECELEIDEGRMLQVFSNIIGNAIKFTPEEGVISVNIERCGPEFVEISVKDSGPGIPKDHLLYVFDRFWQANQTKRLGTGLGLAIVKGIVDKHGGEIWVESEPGDGAVFHIRLPVLGLKKP